MSTLFVLLLSLAPQSGDLADLEHLNPDVRELTARVAGLKKTNAAVPHLIQRLGDESAKVREAAQAALESITGRSDLKDAAGWKSWWIAEGRKEFPSALLPPEGVLLQIQKEMQDLDVRAQTTKKEVRAVAIIGASTILLFVIMMLFFVGHVSSKIKGWRDLVGRAEIYVKHSQELTQRLDRINAELDAKKAELAAALETLRKEQEEEIARRGDEVGTSLAHQMRTELQTLRQRAERELEQTVTALKTELEAAARRALAK